MKDPDRFGASAVACSGLVALAIGMGIGRFAFTPILPVMRGDFGLSVNQAGWLASANYVGYLVGALWAMRTSMHVTRAIRGSLLVVGILTLAMGLTERYPAWLALRFLAGIASAWVLVFVSSWALARLAALGRPVRGGLVFSGVGAGILICGAGCLMLMQWQASASSAWLLQGAASLALTASIWPVLTSRRGPAPRSPEMSNAEDATAPVAFRWTPDAMGLVACYGVFGLGYIIPATFLPAMAQEALADPAVFGWSWPIFGAAAMLSTLAASSVNRFVGDRRLWSFGHVVMAAGVALPALHQGIGAILCAALLVGGMFMVITMAGMQEARQLAGPFGTRLIAAMTAAFAAGQVVGPVIASQAVGRFGSFSAALLGTAALLILTALPLARSAGRERRSHTGAPNGDRSVAPFLAPEKKGAADKAAPLNETEEIGSATALATPLRMHSAAASAAPTPACDVRRF